MREIKFRAIHKKTGNWFYYTIPDSMNMGLFQEDFEHWCQFTGLLDKNGKEIYESDLVTLVESPPALTNLLTGREDLIGLNFIGFIEWDDEGADYNIRGINEFRGLGNGKQTIEIIGNIYENPELLGGE